MDKMFSGDALREAIREAKGSTEPIHLIVQADSFVHTAEIITTASATPCWSAWTKLGLSR